MCCDRKPEMMVEWEKNCIKFAVRYIETYFLYQSILIRKISICKNGFVSSICAIRAEL